MIPIDFDYVNSKIKNRANFYESLKSVWYWITVRNWRWSCVWSGMWIICIHAQLIKNVNIRSNMAGFDWRFSVGRFGDILIKYLRHGVNKHTQKHLVIESIAYTPLTSSHKHKQSDNLLRFYGFAFCFCFVSIWGIDLTELEFNKPFDVCRISAIYIQFALNRIRFRRRFALFYLSQLHTWNANTKAKRSSKCVTRQIWGQISVLMALVRFYSLFSTLAFLWWNY